MYTPLLGKPVGPSPASEGASRKRRSRRYSPSLALLAELPSLVTSSSGCPSHLPPQKVMRTRHARFFPCRHAGKLLSFHSWSNKQEAAPQSQSHSRDLDGTCHVSSVERLPVASLASSPRVGKARPALTPQITGRGAKKPIHCPELGAA